MEDFLTMNNILTEDEAATLFDSSLNNEEPATQSAQKGSEQTEENNINENNTTEIAEGENPFEVEEPLEEEKTTDTPKSESVGGGKEGKGKEDTESEKESGTPSDEINIFSSIADAFKEDGVFPDLDDEEISKVESAEDFRDIVKKQIEAGLDEIQKRIYDALNAGVEPSVLRLYENTLNYLNGITDEQISEESEVGENLRRRLLQQDFLNRGYTQDRATRMTEKLFASGEDIEEAKQALLGNKEYFSEKYQEVLDEAKATEAKKQKELEKQAESLKKDILTNEKIFGDVTIDKATRQKVYDNISKPVYKNKETGQYYTALQKYRLENENDFLKNVGLLFTLTDGFTNLDKLVLPTAKKEVKKKLRELEHKLNNTSIGGNGVLKYVGSSGSSGNAKSLLEKGYVLDVN